MKEGRRAYPVVISKEDDGFFYVEIPDLILRHREWILQTQWKWQGMQSVSWE